MSNVFSIPLGQDKHCRIDFDEWPSEKEIKKVVLLLSECFKLEESPKSNRRK